MLLKSIKFSEFVNHPREWNLEESPYGAINLIVGKNSCGKTRLLNVISGLAKVLSGERSKLYSSGNYLVHFEKEGGQYEYELSIENFTVIGESLKIDGETFLTRDRTGEGKVKAIRLGQDLQFKAPNDQLLAVSRRDEIQHPFFEDLYEWGCSVKHHLFGSKMHKDRLITAQEQVDWESVSKDKDPNDQDHVIAIFQKGFSEFGKPFLDMVKDDFADLGYPCTDISLVNVSEYLLGHQQLVAISVKEVGLEAPTNQINMSQGMFRALALTIQFAYSVLSNKRVCILIDDIGEGLDFERATRLISTLIEKAVENKYQLFMTTNDRFVMNGVPLDYWSILERTGPTVRVFNKENSKEVFEEFKYVGLNNFDFYASEFYLGKG